MRFYFIGLLLLCACCFSAYCQQDSSAGNGILKPVNPNLVHPFLPDSLARLAGKRQSIEDSLAMFYLRPDSSKLNSLAGMLDTSFEDLWMHPMQVKHLSDRQTGRNRPSRQTWVLATAFALLLFTGLLNVFMGPEIHRVIHSFFTRHTLSQPDRESGLVNSWAFVGLFLIFCLSLGLLLCQTVNFYQVKYPFDGLRLFIFLSVLTCVLLVLKFLILKFIGFLFDIGPIVSEYITILNLTYFNTAFVLLAVTVCFTLVANKFTPILLAFTAITTTSIMIWQFIRNSAGIVSDFRFHKFYLIIYLCALEFCPVLILIKAINR